jgi:hypothetical protein
MINVFRLHQKKLMLVITVLTIVAFVWLYNPSKLSELNANSAYTVYGKVLTDADVRRQANRFFLARDLGLDELIRELSGMAPSENQMVDAFVWNLYVLQHEAAELGIDPTDTQTADRIKSLPVFQTRGQFDPSKYALFVNEKLGPRGFTNYQLEEVVKDSLRLEMLQGVISAPVAVSPSEVEEAGKLLRKVDVQSVSFPLEATASAITVSDDELKNLFTQYQNSPQAAMYLVVPETRVVELVEFAIPADAKPAEGKKIEALQKLASTAVEFSGKAATGDFAQLASGAGLKVTKTPEFDRSGMSRSADADPAAAADLPGIAQSAFLLTESKPISDPIQVDDKFYVAKLVTINPRRAMTFEEARAGLEAQARRSKAAELLRQNADAAIAKIREGVASGKSFADAAAAAGQKVESINGVSPTASAPDQQAIMRATLLMEPGQISGFIPGMQGGYLVYLAARAPLDAEQIEKQKEDVVPGIEMGKQNMLFQSWLSTAREAAKIGQVAHKQ